LQASTTSLLELAYEIDLISYPLSSGI
jgi:hypothetical protein